MTNCFQEDRNPDLRGAEYAFIPKDDPEVDSLYSSGELVRSFLLPLPFSHSPFPRQST